MNEKDVRNIFEANEKELNDATTSDREWFTNFDKRRAMSHGKSFSLPIDDEEGEGEEESVDNSARLAERMKTASRMNTLFKRHSNNAALVVLNLPLSRKTPTEEFVKYTNVLTQGLPRVLMIRGNGNEHVNTFN